MLAARELGKIGASTKLREAFDEEAVAVFNRFIKITKAKVVVSSAWRLGETVSSMQKILGRNGVKCKVIGLTPRDEKGIRGLEIWSWLLDHRKKWSDYLVIDDDVGDIVDYIPERKFIHVENGLMGEGLTEEHFKNCGLVAQWR
jgi:hypothetical protein